MNETKPGATASAPTVRTLWQRLRPFIRRDLKGRLISASIAALVIAGLSWFGISAFTRVDSADAQELRVQIGIEDAYEVCSPSYASNLSCTYDDRVQAKVDEDWQRDVRIRAAILQELDLRIDATAANLEQAKQLLAGELDDAQAKQIMALIQLPDLAPLSWATLYADGHEFDDLAEAWLSVPASPFRRHRLTKAIESAQQQLAGHRAHVTRERAAESAPEPVSTAVLDHHATMIDVMVHNERYELTARSQEWLRTSVAEQVSRSAVYLASEHPTEFAAALNIDAKIWESTAGERSKPAIRYHSPVTDSTRYRLAGVVFLALACFMFVVVSPIVTATATAREREAGTLPVLRMTGMSAGELAMAMVLGPNVFAGVLGGSLLLGGVMLLATTAPLSALALSLFLLVMLASATHLTAIGLGDALGQRVNAMVVGALLGVGILVPGLIGGVLASFGVAATGLLLGPLPALTASVAELSDLNFIGLHIDNDLTLVMVAYSVAAQALLGLICLDSWRRRVEQGWAPLFRPIEGVLLALTSIGCSALALFDINTQHQAQDFNTLNLLTFLSSAFLLPMLTWLLVASLRRPARARAVTDHSEARRAFLRFQGFLIVTVGLVGLTYHIVMNEAGLASADSEVVWATLAQLLLVAETAVATLLWASRRREGKLRVAFIGGAVVLMQIVSAFATYGLEVEHVARTNTPALPLLLNVEISGYWLVFMVLCWAAGLTLILTALLRRRDERLAEADDAQADDDDEFGMPGRRLVH